MMSLLRIIAAFCRRYGFLTLCFAIIYLVLTGVLANTCFAQNGAEQTFQRLNHANGLSNDEVYCITQDRHGMMWFGTADGLNCYDGSKITVYRHRDGDSTSLPQNGVTCVTEDKSGNLWVGTQDYICRFEPVRKSFRSYRMPTKVPMQNIRSILDDGANTFYVNAGTSVFVVDKRSFKAQFLANEELQDAKTFLAATTIFDRQRNLWIMTMKGLFVYETRTSRLRHILTTPIFSAMKTMDNRGNIWLALEDSIAVFNPQTERVVASFANSHTQVPLPKRQFWNRHILCQSPDGLVWVLLDQYLFTINPSTGAVKNLTTSLRSTMNSSDIICGFTDRTGVVWLGDNVRGLVRWSPYKPKFRLWKHNPANPQSISNDYIRGIWENSNAMAWVCTQYGGLNRINRLTGAVKHYRHRPNNPDGIASDELWGVLPAKPPFIWLYRHFFSQELNTATGRFRSLAVRPITQIYQDNDGVFWTSDTAKGRSYLGMVSSDGKRFFPFKEMSINAARLDAMLQDRIGRVWFALNSPLIMRYDKAQHQWDTLALQPPIRRADSFSSMMQDRAGNVWITTKGDGIYRCDTNDHVENITEKDGLPNNNVYGIFEDKNGMIWMSCDRGVVVYNPMTKKFRQYTPDDGLQGWEFNRMAFHQTRGGYIYFGGTDGLNLFHPDSLRDNPHPPRVRMTAIYLMGKSLQSDTALGDLRSVNVSYDHNALSLEFAALDFTAPELNRYSWRLEGFDRDWTEPSLKHETKYTNLSPGDYTFRVKACNSDGVWNENGIALVVTVQPAWYQRWWFWLVCGLALIGAVVMIVRVRVRAVEVQNRLLEVEVHKRTKELREANGEIKRQLEIQDVQSREIELANTELDATLQSLKSTQTQLVQSERMNAIGMLTAGVMHEINNPNAIAYSAINQTRTKLDEMNAYFLSLLDEESKHSPEVQQFQELSNDALARLELAADGARRVKTIVANLQGFTKHQENEVFAGDWAQEIRSTIGLFQLQFQTVRLHVNIPETMSIHANFGELNQVLLNLMVNAIQAGADTLSIEAEYSSKQAMMRVADNGKGMTDATREQIFEPFFSTKGVGNSGLGLSISRHIIERHGGRLSVESEVGKGTTFIVELRSGLA